jgi:hypothetical protein
MPVRPQREFRSGHALRLVCSCRHADGRGQARRRILLRRLPRASLTAEVRRVSNLKIDVQGDAEAVDGGHVGLHIMPQSSASLYPAGSVRLKYQLLNAWTKLMPGMSKGCTLRMQWGMARE